jgi:PAS domain S-box-containing protein/diguanylate cyclase (GGDEF)-like protein
MDMPTIPPLRVLLIDDSAADVEINTRALRELERPLETRVVADADALRATLVAEPPDLILSDFSMPGFSGQQALEIAIELAPEVPFIYVSGTIGEELAIEAMQRGAADYVLKDNLRRLRPAIERALETAERRREARRMERALRASEERFRAIVETTEDWIWEMDLAGRHRYSNASVLAILGYKPAEIVGRHALEHMLEFDRAEVEAAMPELAAQGRGWKNWMLRWRHRNGSVRVLESNAQPLFDESGALAGYRGIDRDVTLRMQQARRIEKQARIQALLSAHGTAALRARDAGALLDMTCRVAVEQGGFLAAVIARRTPQDTIEVAAAHGDAGVLQTIRGFGAIPLSGEDAQWRLSARAMREGRKIITPDYEHAEVPEWMRDAMGAAGVRAQFALPVGDPPWAVLGLFSATPQEMDQEELALFDRLTAEIDYSRDFIAKGERLEYLAYHHPVTGLPNRMAFLEQIGPRLAREPHAVVLAELDRFRYFSNSRGRGFGDALLTAVATRLRAMLPGDALFTHAGGGSFLYAHPFAGALDAAVRFEADVLARCCTEAPIEVDGEQVAVRLHAGVLLAPAHGETAEEIERSLVPVLAEAQARDEPVLAFTEALRRGALEAADIERDLRGALSRGEFELHLQPKFHAASHRLVGAEALLRWRHPERGLVSPKQFIPVLEQTGMILEVGAWVRREGLATWTRWSERGAGALRLAVNVSARELRHAGFVAQCAALLEDAPFDHGLDIELTESMVMDDIGKSVQVLQALRALGCRVAIDDFGTGYSSLNYLSRLPVDALKIDQSFTAQLALSPDTLSLVTNVIGLAHSLGLKVIAEGVEEEEQAKLLRLLRCDELQGYHLGRPIPLADFERTFLD